MHKLHLNPGRLAALALASALLVGCGGDPSSPMADDSREVPAAAVASAAAFSQYVADQQPDDRAAPLTMASGLTPPSTEDEEPLPLK
jgi:hypothetical protein